jgi:hypothetical protein
MFFMGVFYKRPSEEKTSLLAAPRTINMAYNESTKLSLDTKLHDGKCFKAVPISGRMEARPKLQPLGR